MEKVRKTARGVSRRLIFQKSGRGVGKSDWKVRDIRRRKGIDTGWETETTATLRPKLS